jgi:hypothetical protein
VGWGVKIWTEKGVDYSYKAMGMAEQLGLTLEQAKWLRSKLTDAFADGVHWEARRVRQLNHQKILKAKRPKGRPSPARPKAALGGIE